MLRVQKAIGASILTTFPIMSSDASLLCNEPFPYDRSEELFLERIFWERLGDLPPSPEGGRRVDWADLGFVERKEERPEYVSRVPDDGGDGGGFDRLRQEHAAVRPETRELRGGPGAGGQLGYGAQVLLRRPEKYAASMQGLALCSFLRTVPPLARGVRVYERSALACVHVFGKLLPEDDSMDAVQMDAFRRMFESLKPHLVMPRVCIYVHLDPKTCLERMRRRGREAEEIVSED
jgi:hypothetical protein